MKAIAVPPKPEDCKVSIEMTQNEFDALKFYLGRVTKEEMDKTLIRYNNVPKAMPPSAFTAAYSFSRMVVRED